MQKRLVWVGMVAIASVALVAAAWLITAKPAFHGAVIDPPISATEIRLQDDNGQNFTLSSLRGKVVVLYFGYTNCPDECPLTMAHLKLMVDQLGAQAQDVRVIMITTDPKRDTSKVLNSWLAKFNPNFIGLLGTPDQLAQVWKDYGVTVEDGGETHSYFVYMIDGTGKFRETFLPDSLPSDMAADAQLLLAGK
jgi:protein SCO1/2